MLSSTIVSRCCRINSATRTHSTRLNRRTDFISRNARYYHGVKQHFQYEVEEVDISEIFPPSSTSIDEKPSMDTKKPPKRATAGVRRKVEPEVQPEEDDEPIRPSVRVDDDLEDSIGYNATNLTSTNSSKGQVAQPGATNDQMTYANLNKAILTPIIREYVHMKEQHPDFLLLFQIGDFYEMYFDDAIKGAALLDIVQTRRQVKDSKLDIPMCGVPVHALDNYLERLIKKGQMVAVCDQVEAVSEAKKRRERVKRDITRLVTPGTLTEDEFLDARRSNYLASIFRHPKTGDIGLAWLELSTGDFNMAPASLDSLSSDLIRIHPSELLVSKETLNDPLIGPIAKEYMFTIQDLELYDSSRSSDTLQKVFPKHAIASISKTFSSTELAATNALLSYVMMTQKGKTPKVAMPGRFSAESVMYIDPSARKSLELISTQSGEYNGSLLHSIDNTITASGGRLLASRISSPLQSVVEIERRLDLVEFFMDNINLAESLRSLFRTCADIERCVQRVSLGRGSPRDLGAILQTLRVVMDVKARITDHVNTVLGPKTIAGSSAGPRWTHKNLPKLLKDLLDKVMEKEVTELIVVLESALKTDLPGDIKHGHFIANGYDSKLDEVRKLRDSSKEVVQALGPKYKAQTHATSIKMKNNRNLGWYIELSAREEGKLKPPTFNHVQTRVGFMCFKTAELLQLEDRINRAATEAQELEEDIFVELSKQVLEASDIVKQAAHVLASLDVACAGSLMAKEKGLVRPSIEKSNIFSISGGRHTTVEASQPGATFVSNDCHLGGSNPIVWLITGANMGGKSTFLRQNALIAIMAQTGLFVPANKSTVGIVDAVLSRVGASDDLSKNRSTFMVEMQETAAILKRATAKSFVIMDEVGRGTSTQDGKAIAQAVLEKLHSSIQCRTLFATHYHELSELESTLPSLGCYHTHVETSGKRTLFTHKIVPGSVQRSYGIEVARMAGVPDDVVDRAFYLLRNNTSL